MRSWSVIQLDEPVVGDVEDYESACVEVSALQSQAGDITEKFNKIRASDNEQLLGQAARALRQTVGDVDDSLSDLPLVLGDVSKIFRDHSRQLRELRQRADEALARAETRWNVLQAARTSEDGASAILSNLRGQLQSLNYSGLSPDQVETESARLYSAINVQEQHLQSCERATSNARDDLQLSHAEHATLHEEERVLITQTVSKLEGVDLRGLTNREWWQILRDGFGGFFSGIRDWLSDLLSDSWNTFVALSRGEWGDALHYFRDALDKFATLVMVAGVLACIVLTPFTGGASLAAIPAIIAVSEGLDYLSMALGGYLASAQVPHPDTGEPISWVDIGVDVGLGLVLPGAWKGFGFDKPIKKGIGSGLNRSDTWKASFREPGSKTNLGFDRNREFRDQWENADLIRNPRGKDGKPLHGAAKESQQYRSGTELASEGAYEAGEAIVVEVGQNWVSGIINDNRKSVDEYKNGVSLSERSASCQLVPR